MAKGDMRSRLMTGQQPGLVPMAAHNTIMGAGKQDNPMMGAVSPSPQVQQQIAGNPTPITPDAPPNMMPLAPPNTMPIASAQQGRMIPMQSGTLAAQGKHPIGTNKQRMLKYNSPTGY